MNKLKTTIMTLAVITLTTGLAHAMIDFEDVGASLAPESHWSATLPEEAYASNTESFQSGSASFQQTITNWGTMSSWGGFTYSNETDLTSPDFTNGTSAYANTPGNTYCVAFVDGSDIVLDTETTISGMWVTNTTYTYLSMLNGDGFAKKFGGDTGNDPDWLRLSITGTGSLGSETVDFMLADFTFADNSQDYIVDTWTWVDLSGLGQINKLNFLMTSSDSGDYGMNTPAYFAMDNINGSADVAPIPEPLSIGLLGFGAAILRKRK